MKYWNEELETMPWPEVQHWQMTQLGKTLPSLRQRSAFYARLYAGIEADFRPNAPQALAHLPFTTKADIRQAQAEATDAQPLGSNQSVKTADVVQVLSSSGTTGAPLYYGLTAGDVERVADAVANNFFTAGLRRDDVVAHLVGLPMLAGGLPYADGFRRLGATLCWLGGFPTERILREMRRLRVTALLATTSFAQYLAEESASGATDRAESRSSLRKILCGGEPGLDQIEVRRGIQSGLGLSHLRDTMGLGDMISGMWAECEAGQGMHFNAQRHVMVELIDPDTGAVLPWRDGEHGELVYSALARDATPLVRYRSRDHAVVAGACACSCGRTSPRIRCIGRTDDMVIYKGMNVFPTAIRDVLVQAAADRIHPVVRIWKDEAAQVRFERPIEVDVELRQSQAPEQDAELVRSLESAVRTQLQVRISISLVMPGELPRSVYKNSLLAVRSP